MKYTIAASHPKIMRRFKTLLSEEFLHCFSSLTEVEVGLSVRIASSHGWAQRKWFRPELENDHELLGLLEIRNKVVPDYKTNYPNIVENALKFRPHINSELFNDATCKEYHHLFKHLINQYQNTMCKISDLACNKVSFENELDLAVDTGHMLLTMVKGRAFHMYLSAIAPLFSDLSNRYQMANERLRLASKARQMQSGERDADQHEADQREADQREADEREIESGSTLYPPIRANDRAMSWEKIKSWIMLILVQLDAADALCDFVKRPELAQAEIDVKLAYSPLVSYETITLEELLRAGHIPEPDGTEITNAELLNFVKAANVRKQQLITLSSFKNKWDKKYTIPAANQLVKSVLDQATEEDRQADSHVQGSGGVSPNAAISALCGEITALLDTAVALSNRKHVDGPALDERFSALAEQLMERQPLPFREGTTFSGTLHCEAGLASILDQTTRGVIQARIKELNVADPKDERLHHSLSELLEQTKVGLFSVQPVPNVNPCSIHGGRASRESSGYQNAAAQCAIAFLPICQWMERPPAALSRQASTIPSQNAPYRDGPRNPSWII